jgi:uncharacterized protein (DUF1330 family)
MMIHGWKCEFARRSLLGLALAVVTAAAASAAPEAKPEPKAYVVNEITVSDPARFQTYADQVPATLPPFGGRYLVRGGKGESMSGPPPADRIVILEFPSRAQAKAWRASPAYQKILPIRDATSTSRVYVVEGYVP